MKLHDLAISLATLVVAYCDYQNRSLGLPGIITEKDEELQRIKLRQLATAIMQNKMKEGNKIIPYNEYLESLIPSKGKYTIRYEFLDFIISEIVFLKTFLDCTKSLSPVDLEKYSNEIAQLFTDLINLIKTPKTSTYNVSKSSLQNQAQTFTKCTTALAGLVRVGTFGTTLCESATIMKAEVFQGFLLTVHSDSVEIKRIARAICEERQQALLVEEQRAELAQYALQVKALQVSNEQLTRQQHELKAQLSAEQAIRTDRDATITSLRQQLTSRSYGMNPAIGLRMFGAGSLMPANSGDPVTQPSVTPE